MATFQKANGDVTKLARQILEKFESHGPLLDAKVQVDIVMAYGPRDAETEELTGPALTKNGIRAYGITRNLPLKDRVMGRGDAEIALDGDWWSEDATPEQQEALLDHELHHIALKTKDGQFCYDAAGRPLLRLRKHDVDVGWFSVIAARHGRNSIEQTQAAAIMDGLGQYFWPELAPSATKTLSNKKK